MGGMKNRVASPALCRMGLLALGATVSVACEDIRRFAGSWTGTVSADPNLRRGFAADASLRVSIVDVDRARIAMTLDLQDGAGAIAFEPIAGAAADVLGELRLPGEPLRTYLGYLRPAAKEPTLAVVSLFPEDRVEARIIRGPQEIYGVFALARERASAR